MKFCGHCGAKMDDSADVCVNCKTPFNVDMIKNPYEDKKEGSKMAVVTTVILISAIIIIACYYFIEISFFNNLLDF